MNIEAARAVIRSAWPLSEYNPTTVEQHVAAARVTIADPRAHASQIELAKRIVAAADQPDENAEKDRAAQSPEQKREAEKNRQAIEETRRIENQRKGSASAEEVLGLFVDGSVMTADGCPSGVDHVDYLRTPGAVLAPVGKTVLKHLEALAASDPTRRARSLGINVQAVTAAARREGLDPTAALKAEVEFREMIDRERAADGLGPAEDRTAPVADGRIIGADGDLAKAEADLQALVARENAAAGVK